ncbi:hypothetical protein OEZ85_003541 [Tetradesmus obliquus]|uniref:HMA domain-containing protein n=1 Tax=Tetradesmus obliquus TaxID=3088 RepID=A0ABY8UBM8_TETOB|nr:hypothetical protein OEZ85_003541 [Tetradesmus obliquus]
MPARPNTLSSKPALRHFAAAGKGPWADVKTSLAIGGGVSSLAYAGGSGPNGPGGGGCSGWGAGGGGEGWHAGPGPSSISNALCDVAVVGDTSAAVEEVILLDVGGMKCGGCVGHVKKLLEEHPAVLHATVNLATETALVRVTLAAGADLDKLAADLAKVLTSAGFKSQRSKKPAE